MFPVFRGVGLFCCVLLPCCLVDMLWCCHSFVGPSERSEQSTSQSNGRLFDWASRLILILANLQYNLANIILDGA